MGCPIEILQAVDPGAATELTRERLELLREITALQSRLARADALAEAVDSLIAEDFPDPTNAPSIERMRAALRAYRGAPDAD